MTKYIALISVCLAIVPMIGLAEGNIQSLKDYEYWDDGKIKKCLVYDPEGRLKAKAFCRPDGTVEKVEKYDAYGNQIEIALYDEKGMFKTGIDGWAAMRSQYEGSRLVSQTAYDETGRPTERKQYSEGGRLVLRQVIEKDEDKINPYEEAYMAATLGNRNLKYRRENDR